MTASILTPRCADCRCPLLPSKRKYEGSHVSVTSLHQYGLTAAIAEILENEAMAELLAVARSAGFPE